MSRKEKNNNNLKGQKMKKKIFQLKEHSVK